VIWASPPALENDFTQPPNHSGFLKPLCIGGGSIALEPAVHYGPVIVGRGTVTDVFVDMPRVTLLSQGLSLIEALLGPLLAHDPVDAVGGPALGAIPLVTLMARHRRAGFYIRLRESAPGHPVICGTPPRPGMAVVLLDDLAAPGTSLQACSKIVQGLGARVVSAYTLIDREQGARERCAACGLRYRPLITLAELVQPATGP
jgi:orotate phosphoribosyltransferase